MDFLIRTNGPDESRQPYVLNNERVRLQGNQFFKEFGQFLQFSFKNKDVHCEKGPYPADTCVANHVADIFKRKVFGAAPGIPMRNTEIYGIGAVVDSRFEHFSRAHGQQKFRQAIP